jgi:hypothetical protein
MTDRPRIDEAKLADLHEKGRLLHARDTKDEGAFTKWVQEYESWESQVVAYLERYSVFEAASFKRVPLTHVYESWSPEEKQDAWRVRLWKQLGSLETISRHLLSTVQRGVGGGQGGAGASTSSARSSARTQRQEKANLLREAKLKLVVKYLEDEPPLHDLTYEKLSAALKTKGVSVNPAFLSRNLRNTKYDRGRVRGNPHRAAAGKGEREGVAVDGPADLSEVEAWTMPDDHT